MKNITTLSKETLLVYLINELSKGNFKVTTHLDENGCWVGKIDIEVSHEEENNDDDYYRLLARHL
jgi:hypothetical protein